MRRRRTPPTTRRSDAASWPSNRLEAYRQAGSSYLPGLSYRLVRAAHISVDGCSPFRDGGITSNDSGVLIQVEPISTNVRIARGGFVPFNAVYSTVGPCAHEREGVGPVRTCIWQRAFR